MNVIISIICISILIVVHEFGHFFCARKLGVRVEKFSLGFGPELFKRKRKGTEYSIAAIPMGGFVKMAGDNLAEYKATPDEYLSQPPGARFWIIACGPLLNYILGFLFFCLVFFLGYPSLTTRVGDLIKGFGAEKAGVQVGDKITAIDGKKITYWEELQKIIYSKEADDKVILSVLRNNQEEEIEVLLKEERVPDPLGQKKRVALLGIRPSQDPEDFITVRHGFFESVILGAQRTWDLTRMIFRALWLLVSGQLPFRESVTGVVGIVVVFGEVAKLGFVPILQLVAILSISLAIFNFLPLPILDGGHIALLGLEKIRKKSISIKTEQIIARVGFALLISLAIFVTYNDIVKFFGDKIGKFFGK
jgi:regulator of sigma E protease